MLKLRGKNLLKIFSVANKWEIGDIGKIKTFLIV